MDKRLLKSIEIPEYYLEFVMRYIKLDLYSDFNSFFKKAIENLIRQEEIALADLQVSQILNGVDILKNKCSNCNTRECHECITQINDSITMNLTEISNLSKFINSKKREQEQVLQQQRRKINHIINQMRRIRGK